MSILLKEHYAAEQRSLQYCLESYPETIEYAKKILQQISRYFNIEAGSAILEIGAAQGKLCLALQSLGYKISGVEPYEAAIEVSKKLAEKLDASIDIEKGFAENIPKKQRQFSLVIALSVLEHVKDVPQVLKEVTRVLEPRGAFYFSTASLVCPLQAEIKYFPFFPWFPHKLKLKIMYWAVKNKPSLVGYTTTPAINWFSPWGTRKLLREAGFTKIYDGWDLIDESSYGKIKQIAVKIIKKNRATKFIGDLFIPSCDYLAIRE